MSLKKIEDVNPIFNGCTVDHRWKKGTLWVQEANYGLKGIDFDRMYKRINIY